MWSFCIKRDENTQRKYAQVSRIAVIELDFKNGYREIQWVYASSRCVKYFGNQNCNSNKSIMAQENFGQYLEIKKDILWEGNLWTSGYYVNTVEVYGSQDTIGKYIRIQEKKVENIISYKGAT